MTSCALLIVIGILPLLGFAFWRGRQEQARQRSLPHLLDTSETAEVNLYGDDFKERWREIEKQSKSGQHRWRRDEGNWY